MGVPSPEICSIACKVDRDGSGSISLTEYFAIFEEHGVKMSKSESERLGIFKREISVHSLYTFLPSASVLCFPIRLLPITYWKVSASFSDLQMRANDIFGNIKPAGLRL